MSNTIRRVQVSNCCSSRQTWNWNDRRKVIFFDFIQIQKIPDSTLAVIYATIGSTASVWKSPKRNPKHCLNSFAANANMPVIRKSCSVCVANRTMRHSFTYAATNARTGSMAAVSAYCRAKPKASTSTFARIVNATILWILPTWRRWTTANTKTWKNSSNKYRYDWRKLHCLRRNSEQTSCNR